MDGSEGFDELSQALTKAEARAEAAEKERDEARAQATDLATLIADAPGLADILEDAKAEIEGLRRFVQAVADGAESDRTPEAQLILIRRGAQAALSGQPGKERRG